MKEKLRTVCEAQISEMVKINTDFNPFLSPLVKKGRHVIRISEEHLRPRGVLPLLMDGDVPLRFK